MRFSIYRFNPEADDARPYMQDYDVTLEPSDHMLLDAILRIKQQDPSLSLRKSCREGVCGSDALNINGRNGLAYYSIRPYLINNEPPPEKERLQSIAQREELNGFYECILCACCSSQCPSFWWNPDKFVGPAGLLQAWRFIADSRDHATGERLEDLNDAYRLFRCRTIMNCTEVCPKGLEPSRAIEKIRLQIVKKTF